MKVLAGDITIEISFTIEIKAELKTYNVLVFWNVKQTDPWQNIPSVDVYAKDARCHLWFRDGVGKHAIWCVCRVYVDSGYGEDDRVGYDSLRHSGDVFRGVKEAGGASVVYHIHNQVGSPGFWRVTVVSGNHLHLFNEQKVMSFKSLKV